MMCVSNNMRLKESAMNAGCGVGLIIELQGSPFS